MRLAAASPSFATAALLALLLAGCGDFWQSPNSSTGTTASTTSLTVSSTSVTAGTSVTLTATVSPSAATGTVTFYNNSSTTIGTATLSSGTASTTASFSTAGTESLTAAYGGNSTYAASTSSAVSLTVTAASSGSRQAFLKSGEAARETNLVLDPEAVWTAPATVHLHNVAGVVVSGSTVRNVDGGGHCVFYSGSVYFAGSKQEASDANPSGVYELQGGDYLAPEGTADLDCE